jgi:hypothetical protein
MIYLQLFRDYGERQTHSDPIHRNEVAAFCRPASERRLNWNDFVKPRAPEGCWAAPTSFEKSG